MQTELSDELKRKKEAIREWVDVKIKPFAKIIDQQEVLHPDVIQAIKDEGYLGAVIPPTFGGQGFNNIELGVLNEEIGRACSSTRSLLTVQGMVALGIVRWGSIEQKELWLPKLASGQVISSFGLTEPNIGSDAKNIEMSAVLENDQYVLNGTKKWITLGQIADLFLVFAKCDEKPTAFLVERNTEGLKCSPINGLLGARGSMLAEVKFDNCRIPAGNILGKVGTGMSHIAMTSLDYGRYSIACGCIGLAQACLDESLKYARKRKQFGKRLRENQLIQKMIAEMVVNVRAGRLLCVHTGYLKDMGDPDSIMETWNAKYFASTIVNKIASDAVQIHGANGCHKSNPVERYYRDAKINEIIEGTTQMHEVLIATNAFREA